MTSVSRYGLYGNAVIWLTVTVLGFYLLFNIKQYVNFGIDLVGGTYLTLNVKVEEAVKNELHSSMDMLVGKIKKKDSEFKSVPKFNEKGTVGYVEFGSPALAAEAKTIYSESVANEIASLGYEPVSVVQEGNALRFSLSSSRYNKLKEEAIDANISILRSRLDVFGAGEIPIFPQGERSIVVELPNVSDPQKAKERIGKSALLEMKPVYEYARTKDELLEKIGEKAPEGTMIVQGKPGARESGFYLVPSFSKLTGRLLKDAYYGFQPPDFMSGSRDSSPHQVHFKFNTEGTALFEDMTTKHVGNNIAIMIDNVVISSPSVKNPIGGGEAYISGDFSEESANELVALLKSGAFAAPVEFAEERTIAPTLGSESIQKGLMSCIIGLSLLLIFSIMIYKLAGVFAFTVLLYNLLLILFALAVIPNVTLTLPGIAGMVLTVGMAIDSSILIYEQIKEELARGSALRNSIDVGFGGAMTVILDANITTFIVGAVLYYMGSPAIQGFALTMMVGIISTLITGLIMLRWVFKFAIDVLGLRKISF